MPRLRAALTAPRALARGCASRSWPAAASEAAMTIARRLQAGPARPRRPPGGRCSRRCFAAPRSARRASAAPSTSSAAFCPRPRPRARSSATTSAATAGAGCAPLPIAVNHRRGGLARRPALRLRRLHRLQIRRRHRRPAAFRPRHRPLAAAFGIVAPACRRGPGGDRRAPFCRRRRRRRPSAGPARGL